jgi:hypothetical protein
MKGISKWQRITGGGGGRGGEKTQFVFLLYHNSRYVQKTANL